MSWLPGSFSDAEATGDAQACPYSGSINLQCTTNDREDCYYQGPCVPIQQFRDYNWGMRQAWKGANPPSSCGYYTYTDANCGGSRTERLTDTWLGGVWSEFMFGTFNADANLSARAFCMIYPPNANPTSGFYADMFYLSLAPGGY